MSTTKPRIRPKPDPRREQSESPLHDPPIPAEEDPPVFAQRDPGAERKGGEPVIFHEDDRLR
ncbi:MAG: hypothetical protein ACRETZ_17835 [Steroidobacteraceae bacterium]